MDDRRAPKWGPYCTSCGHPSSYHGASFCQVDAGSTRKKPCDCNGYLPTPDPFGGPDTARDEIVAIHEPYQDLIEAFHEGDEEHECPDPGPYGCPGHHEEIMVCRECGHVDDVDGVTLRPWPCPTLEVLGITA